MSFYTSLSGLRNAQTELGVISHNIANVETNGFKRSSTRFADIVVSTAMTDPKMVEGIGARVTGIVQNFGLGPIVQTGSALDVAIMGDGFFSTRSAASGSTQFTRNGAFEMDGGGFVHDGALNRLQVFPTDPTGAVTSTTPVDLQVPLSNGAGAGFAGLTVGSDGRVSAAYADGSVEPVGRIALANFVAPTGLRQVGASNWEATGLSGAPAYGEPGSGLFGDLLSGAIERSNVDIAEELVGLITAQRNFQANAKAIDTATRISQTVINMQT